MWKSPVALALVARADEDARLAIDTARSLAPTTVAVHACDPGHPKANSGFLRDWEFLDPGVDLVLIAAGHAQIGTEIADYLQRRGRTQPVHAVIFPTPQLAPVLLTGTQTPTPVVHQLHSALHQLPWVVVHWVLNTRGAWRATTDRDPRHG